MTFTLTVLLGVGSLFVISALENTDLRATFQTIMRGEALATKGK